MQDILWHPEQNKEIVTHFSAGGFGACAYQAEITVAELVSCWQHEEYQAKCPYCGETAYIIRWAGKVNDGCFWDIRSFCPHCGKEHHAGMCGYKNIKGEDIHYKDGNSETTYSALRLNLDLRLGIAYNWKNYFIGIQAQFNNFTYKKDQTKVNIYDAYARMSLGVRL